MIKLDKYFFTLFVFLFFVKNLHSQKTKIDSLKIELLKYKEKDTTRIKLLLKIVKSNYKNDYEDNVNYLDEAEKISKDTGYKKGIPSSLFYRGLITSRKSKYKSGDEYYKKAIPLYKELNMNSQVINCYLNLSIISSRRGDYQNAINYRNQRLDYRKSIGDKKVESDLFYIGYYNYRSGKFDKCLSYYNKALQTSQQNNNRKMLQNSLTAIGNLYSHQGNYPLALEYLNRALDNAKKHKETKNISDALVSIGNTYIRLQDYDNAISFHKKALMESNHDNYATISHNLGESYKYKKEYEKALDFFKDALVRFREKSNKPDEGVTLNKIGEIYFEKNSMNEANSYFEKAKKINNEVKNLRGLSGSYLGLAKVHYYKREYDLSLSFALKVKMLSEKLELLDVQKKTAFLLSKIYEKTNNYKKAFENHHQFKILNDSLFNKENIEKIAQLEYEYKYKQALDSASIRELQLTKTVKTTTDNLEKSQRNLLLGVIGFLITLLALGAIIFFLKLRNEKAKTQNIAIEQKLLRSQMTPHFIFNSLSVLQGMILNKEEVNSVSYLSKFSKLLRTILENSRHKVVVLSEELSAIDSYIALQNLDVKPPFKYNLTIDSNIDKTKFKIPPMLIQPFIENAIEHAFPNKKDNKEINVVLTFKVEELICTIEDNGVGINEINQKLEKNKNSLATTITSERLEMLSKEFKTKGSVEVKNRKVFGKEGTLVTLVVPYKI